MSKERLYIFGGSFDPFHIGHEAIINSVAKEFGQVLVIPTQNPWKNKACIPLEDKIKDLKEFFNQDSRVEISSLCLENEEFNYMYKVVDHFPDKKIVFVMGEDTYEKYPNWKNFDDFKNKVETLVFKRSHGSRLPMAPRIRLLPPNLYQNEISSTLCRENPKKYEELIPLKMREIMKKRLSLQKA